MQLTTLWKLTNEQLELYDRIASNQGELTDDIEQDLTKLGLEVATKTDNIVSFLKGQDDFTGIIEDRIAELNELKRVHEAKKNRFLEYVRSCLMKAGITEIKGTLNKISIRKDSSSVDIENADLIPADYIVVVPAETKIDKAALLKDLLDEKVIPGARLKFTKGSISYK